MRTLQLSARRTVLRDLLARWGLIVGDVEPNEELCRVTQKAERSLEAWSEACKEHATNHADLWQRVPVRRVK